MKYTTTIGILLIAIGIVASFVGKIEFGELFQEPEFLLGLLYGGGVGILFGGLIGWLYKKDRLPKNPSSNAHSEKQNQ
ncbi:MAG: hypothetical protein WCY25_11390 [Moheibacter sp.]